MQNGSTNQINPLIVFAAVMQLVFMIFVGVSIGNIVNTNNVVPKMGVTNMGEATRQANLEGGIANLTDEQKSIIEGSIYDVAALNNTQSIGGFGAKIRDGSVANVYLKEAGVKVLNFMVDIESLKQSYRVVYRVADSYPNKWVSANEAIMAFCPREDELIYGDFNCKDNYGNNGTARVTYELVRYKLFDDFTVGLIGDVYQGEPLSFQINTISDDEATKAAAVGELRDYLKSVGLNLDNYTYTASSYRCCGGDE